MGLAGTVINPKTDRKGQKLGSVSWGMVAIASCSSANDCYLLLKKQPTTALDGEPPQVS